MTQGRSRATVYVTIEPPNAKPLYRVWEGTSVALIHSRAREKYEAEHGPRVVLQFGKPIWRNSYGAH